MRNTGRALSVLRARQMIIEQCLFCWELESSFNDGTTQTALDPLGRGGRFAPIKSSNYGGRPLTGPTRPEDLSELRLVECSESGWVNE
jgi:hypothetical protein